MSNPWMKFYPSDWRSDPMLRICSLQARGLWLEMIALMHESDPYGHLLIGGRSPTEAQLASLVGSDAKVVRLALSELRQAGVFSQTDDGTIYSRRMIRDVERQVRDKNNGKLGGSPALVGSVPKASRTSFSRKDNPTKVEQVWASCGGKCAYCRVDMQRENPNAPTAFTIDHVVALAEGGSNDISNLVGCCRDCNRRKGITPAADYLAAGDKAQKPEARDTTPNGVGGEPPIAPAPPAPPAPVDPVKALFDSGIELLAQAGTPDKQARALIGQWRRQAGDAAVMAAIARCREQRITNPVPWLSAAMRPAAARRSSPLHLPEISDDDYRAPL